MKTLTLSLALIGLLMIPAGEAAAPSAPSPSATPPSATPPSATPPSATSVDSSRYVLGSDDVVSVHVRDIEEYSAPNFQPIRIDPEGNVRLPLVGRIHAAGLSVEQFEALIRKGLSPV